MRDFLIALVISWVFIGVLWWTVPTGSHTDCPARVVDLTIPDLKLSERGLLLGSEPPAN